MGWIAETIKQLVQWKVLFNENLKDGSLGLDSPKKTELMLLPDEICDESRDRGCSLFHIMQHENAYCVEFITEKKNMGQQITKKVRVVMDVSIEARGAYACRKCYYYQMINTLLRKTGYCLLDVPFYRKGSELYSVGMFAFVSDDEFKNNGFFLSLKCGDDLYIPILLEGKLSFLKLLKMKSEEMEKIVIDHSKFHSSIEDEFTVDRIGIPFVYLISRDGTLATVKSVLKTPLAQRLQGYRNISKKNFYELTRDIQYSAKEDDFHEDESSEDENFEDDTVSVFNIPHHYRNFKKLISRYSKSIYSRISRTTVGVIVGLGAILLCYAAFVVNTNHSRQLSYQKNKKR